MRQDIKINFLVLFFISLTFFLLSCAPGSGDTPSVAYYHYPSLFSVLDSTKMSGTLKVYDGSGQLVYEGELTIGDGVVSSESFDLPSNSTYTFVLSFYYATDGGETLALANVIVSQSVGSGSVSVSYDEEDIGYDNSTAVDNDLSPNFSIGFYEIANLDSDGDGVSNIREIIAGSDPLDPDDMPDAISVNLVEGQTVQDSVMIIAQFTPSEDASILYLDSPSGFKDENAVADIFQTTWDTTASPEDENKTFSFYAKDTNGTTFTHNVTVLVDNDPNITFGTDSLIQSGEFSILSWEAGNYSTLAIDNDVGALSGESGTKTVSPKSTTTYTLTATRTNSDGVSFTSSKAVTIQVNHSPSFLAHSTTDLQDPTSASGVTLSWSSSDSDGDALTATINLYEGLDCAAADPTEQSSESESIAFPDLEPRMDYSYTVNLSDGNSGTATSSCSNFTTGDAGLLSWWRMDEGSGSSVIDSSGNSHLGSFVNSGGGVSWATGVYGSALSFGSDGSYEDYLSIDSDFIGLELEELTDVISFDLWVYIDPQGDMNGGIGYILSDVDESNVLANGGFGMYFEDRGSTQGTNAIKFYGVYNTSTDTTSGDYFEIKANRVISEASWYHVVATVGKFSAGSVEADLYVDGALKASGYFSYGETVIDTGNPFLLGGVYGRCVARPFSGRIDEVAVYDRVLSEDEIAASCQRNDPTGNSCD